MSSVETQELYEKFQSRARALNPLLNHDGSNLITAWLPIRRRKNGTWLDDYTNNRISAQWNEGYPTNDPEKSCGIGSLGLGNWYCENTSLGGGLFCSCQFPEYPFLTMRGLCKDPFLDQTYLPQNSPLDGETTFYGNRKSVARFMKEDFEWRIETNVYNTTAVSKEISGRFMLGKQNWTVEGDSKMCHGGKEYNIQLKLTSCNQTAGEFTCDDGQCIEMEERCDQVPDCRDESDENNCELILMKNNYNKNIPPTSGISAANVSISINLMKVVEIEEVDHFIIIIIIIIIRWTTPSTCSSGLI